MKRWKAVTLPLIIFIIVVLSSAYAQIEESVQEPQVTVDEIYVELENFQLYAFSDGEFVESFPISTGYDTAPTPTGEFEIINKLEHPWYTPSDEPAVAPGDEDNPIGTRWMGINKPSYGLHGTTEPDKIQEPASDGCIRLLNEHVETLYEMANIGTQVIIQDSFERETITRLAEHTPEESSEETEEERN